MLLIQRLGAWLKAPGGRPAAGSANAAPGFFAPPYPTGGWWKNDPAEQLRNYSSWVYVAVNAIAQETARQKPYLYVNSGQAAHEQTPLPHTHPLCRLLDEPNPWMTPWELWYLTIVSLELTGNCFWYIAHDRVTGMPVELWIVPTPWVKVLPDARNFVKGYEVSAPGVPTEWFDPSEIVHLKYPNPLDPHYGLSPLQANALTVDTNSELLKSRYQAFLAGSRPGLVLQTEQMLSDQTLKRFEERLTEKFAGRGNWHRPLVLEQGLKALPWTLTPAEMDFLNSSKMSRDEILSLFRVPLPMIGIVENIGLGADIWHGARVMFCEGTVQPKLELLGQSLTRDLARRYGPDVVVSFPDCSPRVLEDRRKDDELDAHWGLRTYNEIRKSRGLRPIADAKFDAPILPNPASRTPSGVG